MIMLDDETQKIILLVYAGLSELMPFLPNKANGVIQTLFQIIIGTAKFIQNYLEQIRQVQKLIEAQKNLSGKAIDDPDMLKLVELVKEQLKKEWIEQCNEVAKAAEQTTEVKPEGA